MFNNTPEKALIILFIIIFISSSLFLFQKNAREMNLDLNKDWWSLYFNDPEIKNNYSFTIENHSQNINFNYTVEKNKEVIQTSKITALKGETKNIPLIINNENYAKIKITVTNDLKEKKEIYK